MLCFESEHSRRLTEAHNKQIANQTVNETYIRHSLCFLMILCFVQEYTQYAIFKILINPTTRTKSSNKNFIKYNRRLI